MAKKKNELFVEVAWEVCNQVGGIYTVLRSKVPASLNHWGEDYCMIGPYFNNPEFEHITESDDAAFKAVKRLNELGYEAYYGYWLVSGKPKVVLLNPFSIYNKLGEIKFDLWEHHGIDCSQHDDLLDQVLAFGYLSFLYITELCKVQPKTTIKAHFHEWMAGVAIPVIRREKLPVKIVFTTHATLLGRYLAMNEPNFYDRIESINWEHEAKYFNALTQVSIERAASHGAHIFTTVSEVTAKECVYLLGKKPDMVLPNGLNVTRYEAMHEFQGLHREYKEKIHRFVMGHFFQSYKFDLDKTLYFFTSGRYEYKNKGYDITLEALARLNYRLEQENSDMNVVMFFITKKAYQSVNVNVLESRALLEELHENCKEIEKRLGDKLFYAAAASDNDKLPDLNEFVDEYWRLRYRRTMQTRKSSGLPSVVTHNLYDDDKDEILNFLRASNLLNHQHNKVKIVYHPDFINSTNPLFHMDYGQFVRGCHLGVFPSYYEPWGYTPVECIVRGVPSITSDLSGFGDYVNKNIEKAEESGVYVVNRSKSSFDDAANQLANMMYDFVHLNRRERITQRNAVEGLSSKFDWEYLYEFYKNAYVLLGK